LPIFGVGPDKLPYNEVYPEYPFDKDKEFKWVNEQLAPITTNYFKNVFPATKYSHITIMKLEPGGWIDPHVDVFTNLGKNINIPLTLPKNSMSCNEQGIIPYKIGCPTIFSAATYHAVYNNSSEDRYMISISGCEISTEFKKEIVKEYIHQRKRSLLASQ